MGGRDGRRTQMSVEPSRAIGSRSAGLAVAPPSPLAGAPGDRSEAADRPLLSVIVPAYGGAATIGDCLASLQRALVGWSHELIVVESSGDGAVELIRSRFGWVRLIVAEQRLSAGLARNLGIREARGDWLFFVDQDCLVPKSWVAAHMRHLALPDIAGVGGSLAVANSEIWSGWCTYFLEFLYHFPSSAKPKISHGFLLGSNSSWRSDVLKSLQFPDQTLAEDVLLSQAVRREGWQLIYDPSISVWHYNRIGWLVFLRYCRAMGAASARAHLAMRTWWIAWFERWPILLYFAPFGVLSMIALRLWSCPWGYRLRFLVLLPICCLGQWCWADAFRAQLRRRSSS